MPVRATNEVSTKIASNKVCTTNVEVPLQVTTKDLEKVEAGKSLVEFNRKKKDELAQATKAKESKPKLSYGIGAVIAVGLLSYYIYQRGSPEDNNAAKVTPVEVQTQKRANNFQME